jgi:cysteine desulfurase
MTPLYFDYNATTPVRPEVFEAMEPFLSSEGVFGNPSSLHTAGQRARAALENAREQVALFLGAADPDEIVFTSCGTESDNMAVKGAALAHRDRGRHVITSAVEHHAVLNVCRYLEAEMGYRVTTLPVNAEGRVDPENLRAALEDDTVIVTVMAANNEVGAVQPWKELGALCRERGILYHADGVQAAGKLALNLKNTPVDLFSISGHKLYAPKGIGALYIRRGARLHPLLHGGSQEKNRRAGTENVAGAVALGAACALIQREFEGEEKRLRALRDRFESGIKARVRFVRVNGPPEQRLSNTTHVTFEGVEGESLVLALDQAGFTLHRDEPGVAVSTGSACASGLLEPSHVLTAMGMAPELIHGSVRFSMGYFTTPGQVDQALDVIPPVVERLRSLSPVWEDRMAAEQT